MASNDPVPTSPVASRVPHRLITRSPPRASVDASPRTPTSPFLHNLSNRFRKNSNASNFIVGPETPTQQSTPVDGVEAAQSAKRFVLSVVRNDWEWPPPQPPTMSGGENKTAEEAKQESILVQREPIGWRTRHEGASDLDLDDLSSPVTGSGKRKNKRNGDPYKFESPDAIANVIQEQRYKRRRANAEEAVWNDGLRTWCQRRDAWTSAETQKPPKRSFSETDGARRTFSPIRAHHKPSTSSEEAKFRDEPATPVDGASRGTNRRTSTAADTDSNEMAEDDSLNGPYLPIYPPLFPTSHTLRARIKPTSYPTIYSKVVLQSLTPNVPIPLTHMIGALVDGWKAEGNWPPQTLAEQQQHALLKRAKGAKKGETAFQKWRKERDAERSNHVEIFNDDFIDDEVDDENEKKGFRRSISGAVKKVFGMHHHEDEEDGGLSKLGLSFLGENGDDTGLLRESQQVTNDNVVLNKPLLEEKG